ncbi:MAG: isoprenyl transferase [Alphaproteobacteria bacterium]|nr:isoprenyl transferase [Alphaproteobacteria bacterium]MBV8548084.1 isoprenyl transferase [Alphaproteobacteria bacterium]
MSDAEAGNNKLHIAIIMDGNGRWARARGLPRTLGHKAGIEAVRRTLRAAKALPVSHLTLYSFSSENWRRPAAEVGELMQLLRLYLRSELASMHKEGIRVKIIGDRKALPTDIVDLIEHAEDLTHDNTALTLTLALSYGGRQEITAAAHGLAKAVERGQLRADAIDEHVFQSFLFTGGMPDPDLIIRTSGEKRISNFLLWQSAYAEFVFIDTLWPDFDTEHLAAAIEEYRGRERRYGATCGQS